MAKYLLTPDERGVFKTKSGFPQGSSSIDFDIIDESSGQRRTIIAQREGEEIGWIFLDMEYPPYAEISGLLIHPKYMKSAEDIGAGLIERSISIAEKLDCSILYTMEWKNSKAAEKFYSNLGALSHRLYKRFEFEPAMIQNFEKNDLDICLFNFAKNPCYREFMLRHPLAMLSISGGKIDYHGRQAYMMKWIDPQTQEFLTFQLMGKRHENRPRIMGASLKEDEVFYDAWIIQPASEEEQGSRDVEIHFENRGDKRLRYSINPIPSRGIVMSAKDSPNSFTSELLSGKEDVWDLNFSIAHDLDVSGSSFKTAVVTCRVNINDPPLSFPLSVSFEIG